MKLTKEEIKLISKSTGISQVEIKRGSGFWYGSLAHMSAKRSIAFEKLKIQVIKELGVYLNPILDVLVKILTWRNRK